MITGTKKARPPGDGAGISVVFPIVGSTMPRFRRRCQPTYHEKTNGRPKNWRTNHCVKRVVTYMVSLMFTCMCSQRDVGVQCCMLEESQERCVDLVFKKFCCKECVTRRWHIADSSVAFTFTVVLVNLSLVSPTSPLHNTGASTIPCLIHRE